ncbi:hypothetical protein V8G54_004646 [Vigna mungo]|uniref:Uncharacterized protein n=1 Tax=Vigna mungo TaxID=3915 RepID=A0AAQ3SD57_VIGMU
MVAGNGITNECPGFVPHHVEKPLWIKLRQITLSRSPPPIQKLSVRPSILQAILMSFNKVAAFVGVSWTRRVRNPIPVKVITLFCIRSSSNQNHTFTLLPHNPTTLFKNLNNTCARELKLYTTD